MYFKSSSIDDVDKPENLIQQNIDKMPSDHMICGLLNCGTVNGFIGYFTKADYANYRSFLIHSYSTDKLIHLKIVNDIWSKILL